MSDGKHLVMLGAPGAGKGTQAQHLADEFDWVHISTGDILREAVREGTQLGREARQIMEKGELVPDELILALMETTLSGSDCRHGFILDGFPRTLVQAEKLTPLLLKLELPLTDVVSIEVSEAEVVKRLSQRMVCEACGKVQTAQGPSDQKHCKACGGRLVRRKDDEPETIRRRLQVYEDTTRSLIQYYEASDLVRKIDGLGTMDDVYRRIVRSLNLDTDAR